MGRIWHVATAGFLLAALVAVGGAMTQEDAPASSASFKSDLAVATKASQPEEAQEKVVASIIGAVNKLGRDAAAKQSHTDAKLRAEAAKMQRIMKDEQAHVKEEEEAMEVSEEDTTALLTINESEWPQLSPSHRWISKAENTDAPTKVPCAESSSLSDCAESLTDDDVFKAEQKSDAADTEEQKAARAEAKATMISSIIDQQEDEESKDEDDLLHMHKSKKRASLAESVKADLLKHPHKAETRVAKLKLAMAAAIKEDDHELDEDEKAEEEAEGPKGVHAQRSSEARENEWDSEATIRHTTQEMTGERESTADLLKDVIKDPQQDEETVKAAVATLLQEDEE